MVLEKDFEKKFIKRDSLKKAYDQLNLNPMKMATTFR